MQAEASGTSRMLMLVLVGAMGLAGVVVLAPDGRPRTLLADDIGQVLASPACASDRTAFTISGATSCDRPTAGRRGRPSSTASIDRGPTRSPSRRRPAGHVPRGAQWRRLPIRRSGLVVGAYVDPGRGRNIARLAVSPASSNVALRPAPRRPVPHHQQGQLDGRRLLCPRHGGVFSGSRLVVSDAGGAVHGSTDNGATWVPSTGTVAGDIVTSAAARRATCDRRHRLRGHAGRAPVPLHGPRRVVRRGGIGPARRTDHGHRAVRRLRHRRHVVADSVERRRVPVDRPRRRSRPRVSD